MTTITAPALDTFSANYENPVIADLAADLEAGDNEYTFTLDRDLSDDERRALSDAQCMVDEFIVQDFVVTSIEPDMIDAFQAVIDKMERSASWMDDEGNLVRPSVVCREPQKGEAAGVYRRNKDGTLQILGYTVPKPDALQNLINRAWDRTCWGA